MKRILIISVILVAVLLSACGSSTTGEPTLTPTPAPTPTLTPTPKVEPSPPATLATPSVAPTSTPSSAKFEISNLIVAVDKQAKYGFKATVTVKNIGSMEGTYQVTPKVNGKEVENSSMRLAAGASASLTLIGVETEVGFQQLMYGIAGEPEFNKTCQVTVENLTTVVTFPEPTPTPTPTPAPALEIDREKMIEIFKANALAKWGDDYAMVKYEINKQTEAYDWVVKQTKYPDIVEEAKQQWDKDYAMVKYEYEKQAEAYEWIKQQTAYPQIMEKAKQKWGNDYAMVKYEYEKQVEAYKALQ